MTGQHTVVLGQRFVAPEGHQEQQVRAMLGHREVSGVGQVVADVQGHVGKASHRYSAARSMNMSRPAFAAGTIIC